jgi:hypothetical protein
MHTLYDICTYHTVCMLSPTTYDYIVLYIVLTYSTEETEPQRAGTVFQENIQAYDVNPSSH